MTVLALAVASDSSTLDEVASRLMDVADNCAVDPSGSRLVSVREISSIWPESIMDCLAFSSRYLMASMRIFWSGQFRARSTRVSTAISGVQSDAWKALPTLSGEKKE